MTERTYLIYSMMGAPVDAGHPQEVMKKLGITYQHAVPQSLFDCWQFWNCENVPEKLPDWITARSADPMDWIGNGLSPEAALKIAAYEPNTQSDHTIRRI